MMKHFDEDNFFEDRREGKRERKRVQAKDRSKYKKTDKDKRDKLEESKPVQENLLRGRVLSITPQGIDVESGDNERYSCLLRGTLKQEKTDFKNLVVVGDFVLFEKTDVAEGAIAKVEARRSVLARADSLSRRKQQLIAANIDQVLITVSVVNPPIKPFLVDRYVIAAKKGGMEPIVIVNKIDLLDDENEDPIVREVENEIYQMFLDGYAQAGIKVVSISVSKDIGTDKLREIMCNKASVFSGQSGVGKTSLINLVTGLNLRVGKTVDRTKKGSHTTSTTNLVPLRFGGWCIDTPGIKSFGVWDLKKNEIEQYFTEIHEYGKKCKFPDCSHTHESDCVVLKAVEDGEISPLRYDSYQSLIEGVEEHRRR